MKKNKTIITILLVLFFLSPIFLSLNCSFDKDEDYFPLKEGLRKEYYIKNKNLKISESVMNPTELNGTKTIMVKYTMEGWIEKSFYPIEVYWFDFLIKDKTGISILAIQSNNDEKPKLFSQPIKIILFPINVGQEWESVCRSIMFNDMLNLKSRVESKNEKVFTPYGAFDNCILIKSTGNSKVNYTNYKGELIIERNDYYAKGFGLVRSEIMEKFNGNKWELSLHSIIPGYKWTPFNAEEYALIELKEVKKLN